MNDLLMTEDDVKRFLHIKDFRSIKKRDIIKLTTNLNRMPPELAKKCIEQFPDFIKSMSTMISELSVMCTKAFEAGEVETKAIIDGFHRPALDALRDRLNKEDLSETEHQQIIDGIVELGQQTVELKRIGAQERAHQIDAIAKAAVRISMLAASILGVGFTIKNGDLESLPELIKTKLLPQKDIEDK